MLCKRWEKIYNIEFSDDINISIAFNVGDLTPYIKDKDENNEDLREHPFQR